MSNGHTMDDEQTNAQIYLQGLIEVDIKRKLSAGGRDFISTELSTMVLHHFDIFEAMMYEGDLAGVLRPHTEMFPNGLVASFFQEFERVSSLPYVDTLSKSERA